jgi:hypothetical protein
METARNVKVASTAFHCYSSGTFREEAQADNQTANNAIHITFFPFLAALLHDSGSRLTLTWLRDRSHWTHHTR